MAEALTGCPRAGSIGLLQMLLGSSEGIAGKGI